MSCLISETRAINPPCCYVGIVPLFLFFVLCSFRYRPAPTDSRFPGSESETQCSTIRSDDPPCERGLCAVSHHSPTLTWCPVLRITRDQECLAPRTKEGGVTHHPAAEARVRLLLLRLHVKIVDEKIFVFFNDRTCLETEWGVWPWRTAQREGEGGPARRDGRRGQDTMDIIMGSWDHGIINNHRIESLHTAG